MKVLTLSCLIWIIPSCFASCFSNGSPDTSGKPKQAPASIIILCGQSNALGQHQSTETLKYLPTTYQGKQPLIQVMYPVKDSGGHYHLTFTPLHPPHNTRDTQYLNPGHIYHTITGWGVEQSLMHKTQQWLNDTVYLIKNSVGAISILSWDKDTGSMFRALHQMIDSTQQYFARRNRRTEYTALIWMQGESDTHNPDYGLQLNALMQHIRLLHSGLNQMPVLVVSIKNGSNGYSLLVDQAFQSFQALWPERNLLIDPDDYPDIKLPDNTHYDDSSKLKLGELIFQKLADHHFLPNSK